MYGPIMLLGSKCFLKNHMEKIIVVKIIIGDEMADAIKEIIITWGDDLPNNSDSKEYAAIPKNRLRLRDKIIPAMAFPTSILCGLKLGFMAPRKRPAAILLAIEVDMLPCISRNPGIRMSRLGMDSISFRLEARTKPATIAPVMEIVSMEMDSLKSLLDTN